MRRWPLIERGLDRLKRLIYRRFLRKRQVWLQIQSGLSQGMWMQLRLPAEALIWRGEHDREVQNAVLAVVRPGAVVYDIGAHVGAMTLGAALLAGDSGRVVAFDGDPENIARLRDHGVRNGLGDRLRVVHAAVWSRTAMDGICFRRGATVRSQGGVEADGNRPVLGSGQVINVPAVRLDDFVAAGETSATIGEDRRGGGRIRSPARGPGAFHESAPASHRRSTPPTGRGANYRVAK